MPFNIHITLHPNTLILYPKLKAYLEHLRINQCTIKNFDQPDSSNTYFNLAYLDMYFDHDSIELYLNAYKKRIDQLRKNDKSAYFKLRLLLSGYDYDQLKIKYEEYLTTNPRIPFEMFVLEHLGYQELCSIEHILIIKIEDLHKISNHVSSYAMGYFYYLNHGRI